MKKHIFLLLTLIILYLPSSLFGYIDIGLLSELYILKTKNNHECVYDATARVLEILEYYAPLSEGEQAAIQADINVERPECAKEGLLSTLSYNALQEVWNDVEYIVAVHRMRHSSPKK